MCLVEGGQYAITDLPLGGIGLDDDPAHVRAGDQFGYRTAGRGVVVVEAHYHFCVAVVDGDGKDFDEDFGGAWGWEGSSCEGEAVEAILGGRPLFDCGWQGHFG